MHSGKFIGIAYEKTPCFNCVLTEDSSQTIEYVEDQAPGPVRWPPPEEAAVDDRLPIGILGAALKLMGGLSAREFYILRSRYRGETLPDIAAHLGVGVYEVRAQLRKLLRKAPVLKKLIPVVRARKGPKPKEARGRSLAGLF